MIKSINNYFLTPMHDTVQSHCCDSKLVVHDNIVYYNMRVDVV
jgi:hypothetical protein